ncbi:JAB domain-containing protein [Paraliomyxa miuraensis]|uniref:JAB domain-containing protein n=1 Tax=Paraliomyxa miuraensis TaxID=376150 RepID=UPI002256AC1C|nr:DNA repair protein RadC [Paraliomyxa miuraensis]MCX4239609.1 DNA repair protein RadC [Paraliomyxa miuraensis]
MLGRDQLDDVDLLALILGGATAKERALALLQAVGGLLGLADTHPRQLARIPGVGATRAAKIAAALELGRRLVALSIPHGRTIERLDDVATFLRASIGSAPQEVVMVLGLDDRSRLGLVRTVTTGSRSYAYVRPREVFRPLMQAGMHGVILVHNHPNGGAEPSDADLVATDYLAEVGRTVGIPVLDHLIVTRDTVVSIMEYGILSGDEG